MVMCATRFPGRLSVTVSRTVTARKLDTSRKGHEACRGIMNQ